VSERIDYLDDPDAPPATSLVPSANVIVVNDLGEILMIRRTDNGNWAVPGGAMDLGESMTDAAVRETKEETGISCEITGLVGIYTNPGMLSATPATTRYGKNSRSSSPPGQRAGS
jgi:ADP-ribose pyrophosphatase YjhB (NUDIX family)